MGDRRPECCEDRPGSLTDGPQLTVSPKFGMPRGRRSGRIPRTLRPGRHAPGVSEPLAWLSLPGQRRDSIETSLVSDRSMVLDRWVDRR
jgi:hypothetical protein